MEKEFSLSAKVWNGRKISVFILVIRFRNKERRRFFLFGNICQRKISCYLAKSPHHWSLFIYSPCMSAHLVSCTFSCLSFQRRLLLWVLVAAAVVVGTVDVSIRYYISPKAQFIIKCKSSWHTDKSQPLSSSSQTDRTTWVVPVIFFFSSSFF